jgi:transposase
MTASPCVIDAPINGESFLAYVEQVRVPTLQPGDIVVMDNLGSHKGTRSAGLSAPSMHGSSSCHPTAPTSIRSSKSFAKLKILLRKAKERTIEGVWRRIGNLLQHFTPQECANYLHNAGYALSQKGAARGHSGCNARLRPAPRRGGPLTTSDCASSIFRKRDDLGGVPMSAARMPVMCARRVLIFKTHLQQMGFAVYQPDLFACDERKSLCICEVVHWRT